MAKSTAAAPAQVVPEAATKTFKLRKPLKGGELTELTLDEPTFGHVCRAVREHPNSAAEQTIHMIAALGGESAEVIKGMFIRDARDIEMWFNSLDIAAVLGDKDRYSADDYEATFVLSVPVPTDKKPITEITVRAPDLGASVMAEKFKTNEERTAALIADLSGQTLQVISRIKRRDIARMEAWLGPIVAESDSLPDELGEELP